MIRLRPSSLVFRATVVGSLLPCFAPLAKAQRSIETTVQRERARRDSLRGNADELLRRGDADVIRLDYEAAVNDYRQAVDALNDAPATSDKRRDALKKFFHASIELANERITEGRYLDAEATAKTMLLPQYDPGYKPAIELLQHLEDPDYYNQTVGPKFIQKVQQVKGLFREAQGFYDSARYDLAFKRYEQILALDPYNDAARAGMEKVDRAKLHHSEETGYPETRARLTAEVAQKWELPVPRRGVNADPRLTGRITRDDTGTAAMQRKLQSIIIPNIEFHNTTISDAIEYLRNQIAQLDPDPDSAKRGIGIFLKLPAGGPAQVNLPPVENHIPGLPPEPTVPAPVAKATPRITLSMTRLPLYEALRYIASQAGLKVKIDESTVSLVPLSEPTDALPTAEYRVPPSFFQNSAGEPAATPADARVFLEASGVTFPPGASATYQIATHRLIVRNTPENLDLIDDLVKDALAPPPDQRLTTRTTQGATRDQAGMASISGKLQPIVIPNIEFHNTTISDAVEFLRQESVRLDPDPNPHNRGVNIFLKLPPLAPDASPPVRITLSMQKLPLLEALRYVASQAGLKVKVEQYAVSLVPITEQADALVTTEIKVPLSFFAARSNGNNTGTMTIQRQDAKTFLEASGLTFPPGASATYIATTGTLVMRNTQENVDLLTTTVGMDQLPAAVGGTAVTAGNRSGTYGISANAIDALLFGGAAKPPPPGVYSVAGVFSDPQFQLTVRALNGQPKVAGLLPMRLDLPAAGRVYRFSGGGAPDPLNFRYTDGRAAARWRWVWLTVGALAFGLGAAGWAHPWRRTFGAILTLTFFPLIVVPGAVAACNALLAGWLWAVLGWVVTRVLLRRRRLPRTVLPILAVCTACWLPGHSRADDATPAPTADGETVIVPYDAKQPLAGQEADATYYLPYERFLTLWEAARRHRQPPAPEPLPGAPRYSLDTARYEARLTAAGALEVSGTVDFQTFGEGWVGVPFNLARAGLGTLTLDGAPAPLGEDGQLWVGQAGAHRAAVTLSQPTGRVAAGTHLSLSLPRALAGTISVALPRPDLRVELRTDTLGGGQVEETVPEGRRLTATVGGAAFVELTFRDAPPPAPALKLIPLAHVEAQLTAALRQETLRVTASYAFPGGSENEFFVSLDPSLTLTGLDAPDVQAWHLATGGGSQSLQVVLAKPARDGYRFSLTAQRAVPGPGERPFPLVSALSSRVELVASLLAEGPVDFSLPAGLPAGVRRVEAHPEAAAGRFFAAFESGGSNREAPPSAGLTYGVQPSAVRNAAHVNYLYQIGHGKIELAASIKLTPAWEDGPLPGVDLRLPPGFTVQSAVGVSVRQWWTAGDRLSLRFGPGDAGPVALAVTLIQTFDQAPPVFSLRPLLPEGFAEVDGETLVAADRSFKVRLTLPTGGPAAHNLEEIDAKGAAAEFQVRAPLERQRAFRYRNVGFDVPASLEVLPAQWQAQWVTHATVREGSVALETHLNVRVSQGAVDAVDFTVPGQPAEGRVTGDRVLDTMVGHLDPQDGAKGCSYHVLLQAPLYGGDETSFTFDLDLPLPTGGQVSLPDFVFPPHGPGLGTGGYLLVENVSAGEMTLDAQGLDPVLPREVPFVPAETAAGARFFHAVPGVPWSLRGGVTGLEKSAGRAALVAYAELTSTLRSDGEEWHRAVYRLQNRRLQFLPVQLPPGLEFIGARVAGESVRVDAGPAVPNARVPTLLIPLLKTRPGEMSYDVELVYRRPVPGPGQRREPLWLHWDLDDPTLPGIPVEKTLWNVYLPADARLLGHGGNVEPVVASLSETEKLESSLGELRSLSAVYRSDRASNEERQRALSNFDQLSKSLAQEADTSGPPSRALEHQVTMSDKSVGGRGTYNPTEDHTAAASGLLKPSEVSSQNGIVAQKKEAIRQEIATLNTANNTVGQNAVPGSVITFMSGGTSGTGSTLSSLTGQLYSGSTSDVAVNNRWRDQRNYDVNGGLSGRLGTLNQSASGGGTAGALATPPQGNLALNDSVSINLPTDGKDSSKYPSQFQPPATTVESTVQREQARRASSTQLSSPALPALILQDGRSAGQAEAAAAIPGLPAAAFPFSQPTPPPPAPPATAGERPVGLRSTGRISLAVDFPLEGQVYQFKKVKSNAWLTLRAVRPARFERLGWLVLLVVLLLGWWALQAVTRRLRWRRPTVPLAA